MHQRCLGAQPTEMLLVATLCTYQKPSKNTLGYQGPMRLWERQTQLGTLGEMNFDEFCFLSFESLYSLLGCID